MKKKTFIVPFDFTIVSKNALDHAIVNAKTVKADILILHVVANENLLSAAKNKLDVFVDQLNTVEIKISAVVRIGNIFSDIADFAAEHQAEIVFMGTHGASGWQHITGSNAMKVLTDSIVPFIVVQEKQIRTNGYSDIVVPLDLNKESIQKLKVVAEIAQYFGSKVHFISPIETDDFFAAKVKASNKFAKTFFSEKNIEATFELKPKKNFEKEILKHAILLNADLIAIMNLVKNSVFAGIGNGNEQTMITNEAQIPVLIVNPMENVYGGSVLFG